MHGHHRLTLYVSPETRNAIIIHWYGKIFKNTTLNILIFPLLYDNLYNMAKILSKIFRWIQCLIWSAFNLFNSFLIGFFCLLLGLLAKILRNFVERSVISFSRPCQTNKFLVPTFIVGLTKGPLWIYHCFPTVSVYKCGGSMLIRCTSPDSTIPLGWALCFNCNERLNQ